MELSFTRFEFVLSRPYDESKFNKEAASSKLSSDADFSKLVY